MRGSQISALVPPPLEAALRQAYASPPRAYHDFGHVEELLEQFASVPEWRDATAVALAMLFHDAVYEAGRTDNEARSATFAEELIREYLPLLAPRVPRVKELVMLTARHGQHARAALDLDAAHFLDCDMAILGAPAPRYDAYERAIAEEYREIPSELYRAGRARFLEALLASPSIYLTPHFRERFERSARTNLARALAALQA